MRKILLFFMLTITILLNNIYSQNTAQQGQPGVVEIERAIKIEARIELPQVQIIDKRITPEFEEIRVEKNFNLELSGKMESISFEPVTSGRVLPITNMDKLLSKKRF